MDRLRATLTDMPITARTIRPPNHPGFPGRRTVGLWWLALSAVAIAVFAPLPYLLNSLPDLAANGGEIAANYASRPGWVRIAFAAHIVFGGVALLLSPIQLSGRVRARVPPAAPGDRPGRAGLDRRRRRGRFPAGWVQRGGARSVPRGSERSRCSG